MQTDQQPAHEERTTRGTIASWAAWCGFITAFKLLPLTIVAVKTYKLGPDFSNLLLLISVPTMLLLLLSSLGLFLNKTFGYYLFYLSVFFGGVGGLHTSLIPVPQKWLKWGFYSDDIHLVINILFAVVLAFEHLRRSALLQTNKKHTFAVAVVFFLGLVNVIGVRSTMEKERGQVTSLSELPRIGGQLAGLKTEGTLSYAKVESRLQKSLTLVASGKLSPESLTNFANSKGLKLLTNAPASKRVPQTRAWKLEKQKFATDFTEKDPLFAGRLDPAKLALFLNHNLADNRFTLEIMGRYSD